MTVTNLVIGSSSGTPGTSCQAIYDAGITSDGTYWIRPGASAAVQAQCASGWTTIVRMNASGATSQNTQSAYNGIPTTGGATAKLSHAIIQELVTASAYNNPVKFSFCGTSRYINGDGTWTSSGSRNKLASWTSSVSSTSYATKCGSGSSPDINNGNGGEWASNSVPWPYQDGTCALNGGFANGNPNGCSGTGTGDQFCNPSSWSGSTGCGSTGWYTVDMYVGG